METETPHDCATPRHGEQLENVSLTGVSSRWVKENQPFESETLKGGEKEIRDLQAWPCTLGLLQHAEEENLW